MDGFRSILEISAEVSKNYGALYFAILIKQVRKGAFSMIISQPLPRIFLAIAAFFLISKSLFFTWGKELDRKLINFVPSYRILPGWKSQKVLSLFKNIDVQTHMSQ